MLDRQAARQRQYIHIIIYELRMHADAASSMYLSVAWHYNRYNMPNKQNLHSLYYDIGAIKTKSMHNHNI